MTRDHQNLLFHQVHQNKSNTEWIVLVHGAGGSIKTWKRQVDALGASFNLLIVDLPGHGRSAAYDLGEVYTFGSVADEIWKVVDHLGLSKVHLLGISLGTILCLEMRTIRPERVSSMIMPGAIVQLNRKLRWLARISLWLAKIIGYRLFYNLSAHIMMPRNNHKKSRDVFIKESKTLTIQEFRKWTNLYFHLNKKLNDLFETPSQIPHLLVMGSQDHLFLNAAKGFANYHKSASIEIVEGCGHVVSIEQAQKFNRLCLSFLDQLPR